MSSILKYESSSPEMIFWPGSYAICGFTGLLEAAASGGFKKMAISPLMINQLFSSGKSAQDVLKEAEEKNVELFQMDGVSSWAPLWYQANSLPALKERFDFSREQCLEMAEALGIKSILVAGAFERGAISLDTLIEYFGSFCDLAAKRKMRVELEFVPFWGIPDLSTAWEIVRGADRPNGGMLIDTWHLQKGSANFESDMQLLASIPGEYIQNVQIADATVSPQADELYAEGRFRQFPGDGELAINRIVKTIAEKGKLRWIGAEIFGKAIDDLSIVDAGRRSADSVKSVIEHL